MGNAIWRNLGGNDKVKKFPNAVTLVENTVRTKKKLGKMLFEAGLLTEAQLAKAVKDQQKYKLKLGQTLVREGIVSGVPDCRYCLQTAEN